jgi:nucleoside-diphosphate-sugar epimerase
MPALTKLISESADGTSRVLVAGTAIRDVGAGTVRGPNVVHRRHRRGRVHREHLSEALVAAGWQVRGVDAFTCTYDPRQKRRNLSGLPDSRFDLVEADLVRHDVVALLDGATRWLTWRQSRGSARRGGRPSRRTSNGTRWRLSECSTPPSPRIGGVVRASSSWVYGNGITAPFTEAAPLRPASLYGASKLLGKLLVAAYVEQRALPRVSLRYFSVYGPLGLRSAAAAGHGGSPVHRGARRRPPARVVRRWKPVA